jgi:hypothetical protein
MLSKLPIIINNKIVYILFRLKKNCLQNNGVSYSLYILNNDNNINIIKVLGCNKINGFNYLNIQLPLNFIIINDLAICDYFFQINLISDFSNDIDFFKNMKDLFMKLKIKMIVNGDYNKIDKLLINRFNDKEIRNPNQDINKLLFEQNSFWNDINFLINTSLLLLYNNTIIKKDKCKKLYNVISKIKNRKFSINCSDLYNLNHHLINLNNNNISIYDLEINKNYFISIKENKILFVKIINKTNNIITISNTSVNFYDYKWYYYHPSIKNTKDNIFVNLILNKEIYEIVINTYYPSLKNVNNIIEYYISDHILSKLFNSGGSVLVPPDTKINSISQSIIPVESQNEVMYDVKGSNLILEDDLLILKKNSYDNEFFLNICKKYDNEYIKILHILFQNYNFPIKFNKLEVDSNFDNILYISLLKIDKILINNDSNKIFLYSDINNIVPNKVKLLYYNIIKTFYYLINFDNRFLESKYFNDYIHKKFIKIFFCTNSLSFNYLLKKIGRKRIEEKKDEIRISSILIDIIQKLSWDNLHQRLKYLKIIYSYKNYINYYDRLNKNIISDNCDIRIKQIILNPFDMYKFLKKEKDFIKWNKFLENKNIDLFVQPISLSELDLELLGTLLYLLTNIKEQNIKDNTYIKFLNHCIQNPRLILDNFRINLKIKEYFNFINININLGILAKHLTINKDSIIELDDNDETTNLTTQLKEITRKYIKYKAKYQNIKLSLSSDK